MGTPAGAAQLTRQSCRREGFIAFEVSRRFDDLLLSHLEGHCGVALHLEIAVTGLRGLVQEDDDRIADFDESLASTSYRSHGSWISFRTYSSTRVPRQIRQPRPTPCATASTRSKPEPRRYGAGDVGPCALTRPVEGHTVAVEEAERCGWLVMDWTWPTGWA